MEYGILLPLKHLSPINVVSTSAKSATTSKIERLSAPMPGKILDILVEENAEIETGRAVVILEAMKMQNEIVSHVNGRVKKINIKTNDSVMKDDVMLEIERILIPNCVTDHFLNNFLNTESHRTYLLGYNTFPAHSGYGIQLKKIKLISP
jgi:multidrug efflux pump subunit AcrA (membrane-fusion protein)